MELNLKQMDQIHSELVSKQQEKVEEEILKKVPSEKNAKMLC